MTLDTYANLASVIVALLALVVTFLAEHRNQRRFDEQLHHSQELVQAQIRPLLTISSQVYIDVKSIRLINRGIGAAIITKVEFAHGEQKTTDLVELFKIKSNCDFSWESFRRLPASRVFVGPGETIDLVRLSEKHLLAQNIPPEEARSILEQWQRQKSGIRVLLEYEDALGNRQPIYDEILN